MSHDCQPCICTICTWPLTYMQRQQYAKAAAHAVATLYAKAAVCKGSSNSSLQRQQLMQWAQQMQRQQHAKAAVCKGNRVHLHLHGLNPKRGGIRKPGHFLQVWHKAILVRQLELSAQCPDGSQPGNVTVSNKEKATDACNGPEIPPCDHGHELEISKQSRHVGPRSPNAYHLRVEPLHLTGASIAFDHCDTELHLEPILNSHVNAWRVCSTKHLQR